MPLGPYKNFAECVASVSSWADDPNAYCGWLEQQGDAADGVADAAGQAVGVARIGKCDGCGSRVPFLKKTDAPAPHSLPTGSGLCPKGVLPRKDGPSRRVYRSDAIGELAKPERLANGWLRVEGKIARVGLQEYEDADGTTHMELRLPEEVFAPESLASFRQVPYTDTHPPVLLDAANARNYARGSVGENVRQLDDTWVGAPILITDADAIRNVDAGRVELSNGYSAELDDTQDPALAAKWGAYKFIQRKIRGNHIAGVDSARAGPGARMRLDSRGNALIVSAPTNDGTRERQPMKTIRIDGQEIELSDGNSAVIQGLVERALQRADQARQAAETKATEALGKLAIVKDNALAIVGRLARARTIYDAMKAKMVKCDECGGTGKVPSMDDDSKMVKCDMCDGDGEYRMHLPVSHATGQEEGAADDDDTLSETFGSPDDDMDEDELETEQETEENAGKVNQTRGDKRRADTRARRRQDAIAFAEKRDASLQRRIDRGVRARAALEGVARRFIGDNLAKLDDSGIRKAVIAKLSPKMKLDGKSDGDLRVAFDTLVATAGEVSVSDAARSVMSPFYVQPRTDGAVEPKEDGSHLSGRDRMLFLDERAAEKARAGK